MEQGKELRKIVLIVTQNCNLSCEYCYEHYKSAKNMSFDIAKQIIDNEMIKYGDSYNITIEFFGGEPFLNFDLIRDIVAYTEEKYIKYGIKYCATTNGTVLNENIKEWLTTNRDIFDCALSLDGTEEMHNMNRLLKTGGGSFELIDVNFFMKLYGKDLRVKMTVSKKTLPFLREGIEYLDSLGVFSVVDLVAEAEYWTEDDVCELEKQLQRLVSYYDENSELQVCRMLDYDLRRVFMDNTIEFKYCGAGKNMITYDVNGEWYPCMALAPVSQGESAITFLRESFENFKFSDTNKCRDCKLLRLCRNCYATNYNQSGDVQWQTKIQCEINRMLLAAACKIQYYRIKKKEVLDDTDKWILKAIWKIQETLLEDEFL